MPYIYSTIYGQSHTVVLKRSWMQRIAGQHIGGSHSVCVEERLERHLEQHGIVGEHADCLDTSCRPLTFVHKIT